MIDAMAQERDQSLRRLLDAARIDAAVRSRSGVAALRQRRSEDASLTGLLANLAERAAPVTISTTSGIERRGVIRVAGHHGIILENSGGIASLMRATAIASIRTQRFHDLHGDGSPASTMSWPTMIASLVEPDDEVSITIARETTRGRVRSISRSLVIVTTPEGAAVYAVVDGIDVVSPSVPGVIRHD